MKRWSGRVKRRAGYYRVRDGVLNRLREPRFRRALRSTDAFLVGHPKSGNTWLAYMLATLLADDGDAPVTLRDVGRRVPFVHGRDRDIAQWERLPAPRVFRNEYPRHAKCYPRIIYLVRDPRAVLVSFWHMYRTMFDDRELELTTFVSGYLRGAEPFDRWHRHLPRWDAQAERWLRRAETDESVLVARYEDMARDREAELRRVAAHIGLASGAGFEARLATAVARGSFEAMRESEARHGSEAYTGRARGEGRFVRQGTAEGWRRELTPEVATRIEEAFGRAMRRAGYVPG